MGIPVLIIGKSGSGKTTSLRNFAKDELCFIKVEDKPLPFKGGFDNTYVAYDRDEKIREAMARTTKKSIVVDDFGYISTRHFMKNHRTKKGNASFDMYDEIADKMYNTVDSVKTLPEDVIVYFIMHEDVDDYGNVKPRTIGKLLDNKVCLEGMCTITLRCITEQGEHKFVTFTKGSDVVKTPIGMFESELIDNDLKLVDKTIREYYELGKEKGNAE